MEMYTQIKIIPLEDILERSGSLSDIIDALTDIRDRYPETDGFKVEMADYFTNIDSGEIEDFELVVSRIENEQEKLIRITAEKCAQREYLLDKIKRLESNLNELKSKLKDFE